VARAIIMERCRGLVENSTTSHEGRQLRHTLSLGAAVIRTGASCEALVARADGQLYKAKQLGRNRSCIE
jgi:diguanylate cyclase (GGDEF)-like protein